MKKADDSIIYITLIDFLMQLIFFGIFLFVSLVSVQNSLLDKIKQYQISNQVLVEILDGLGPFIKASNVDLLVKFLNQLNSPSDLKYLIDALKSNKSPEEFTSMMKKMNELGFNKDAQNNKIILELLKEISDPEQAKKLLVLIKNSGGLSKLNDKVQSGMGKISCFSSGSREPIMEIEAYDSFIKIISISDAGKTIIDSKQMKIKIGDQISKELIATNLAPLYDKDCAYFVKYIRRTDSESIRNVVEKSVYIR